MHRRLVLTMLLCLLIASLAGCTACARPEPVAGQGQPEPAFTALQQIPFPADSLPLRSIAAPIPDMIAGNLEYQSSPGSYDSEQHHVLEPYPGDLHWAIYRLPTNGYPALSVQARLVVLEGEYYVGIANYAKGSWEFGGARNTQDYQRAVTVNHISPQDRVYIAVAANDAPNSIRIVNAVIVLDQPGWAVTTAYSEALEISALRAFSDGPGGNPRIAAIGTSAVRLLSTNTHQPSDESDWSIVVAGAPGAGESLNRPLDAEFVDGRPAAIYYSHGDDWQLQYAYATTAEPATGDWIVTDVGSASPSVSLSASLCELGGLPRVAFHDSLNNKVRLASCGTASPASADWQISEIASGVQQLSMAVINGRLACSFFAGSGVIRVNYARALVSNPAGPANWNVSPALYDMSGSFGRMTSLIATPLDAQQAPLIAFLRREYGSPFIFCGLSAEPGTTDWSDSKTDFNEEVGLFKLQARLVGGRPAFAYYIEDLEKLQFAWAADSSPTDDSEWQLTTVLSGVPIRALSLDDVDGLPAIAFATIEENTIGFAYFDSD